MKTIYADLDEMVFDGREKAYGAYQMRKRYNSLLARAALIAFLVFILFTFGTKVLTWISLGEEEVVEMVHMTPVKLSDLPPPPSLDEEKAPPPPPKVNIPPPVRAKIEFKVPKPAPDDEVDDEETIKEMEEIEDSKADIGLEDVEGDTDLGYDFGEIDGTGNVEVEVVEEKKEPEIGPNDFVLLEKEPGPVNMDDLRKMIGYPPMAKEAEIEGKVILRVQVSKSGKYVKHLVIKDPHPILTRAVTDKIRNLSFTPGIQAGKPIKVWVTIPFDFKLLK
ncbi:MAG TPA: energy transducer TonB [Bacteroidetes bacterium]|nr:energy transducer TonB [Bacteroidota bacterium]